jgi:hypothetical protein
MFSVGMFPCQYNQTIISIGLTGLDPAGPMFTDQSCEVRFCKGDAQFTEAIHTNGNPLTGLGTSNSDSKYMSAWGGGGAEQATLNCVLGQTK